MKKLGKLKLNNFSEMSEQEMKFVIGGQYDPNAKKACHETAPTCGGVCAPAFICKRWDTNDRNENLHSYI
jgi:natural product precursor